MATKVVRCNICYSSVSGYHDILECPNCSRVYHRDHLRAWLLNRDICPACRKPFSVAYKAKLQPITNEEKSKLQTIFKGLEKYFIKPSTDRSCIICKEPSLEIWLEKNFKYCSINHMLIGARWIAGLVGIIFLLLAWFGDAIYQYLFIPLASLLFILFAQGIRNNRVWNATKPTPRLTPTPLREIASMYHPDADDKIKKF